MYVLQELMHHLMPEYKHYKVKNLYPGMGTVPEFWFKYLEGSRCVHVSAQWESYIVVKHTWAQSVNPTIKHYKIITNFVNGL